MFFLRDKVARSIEARIAPAYTQSWSARHCVPFQNCSSISRWQCHLCIPTLFKLKGNVHLEPPYNTFLCVRMETRLALRFYIPLAVKFKRGFVHYGTKPFSMESGFIRIVISRRFLEPQIGLMSLKSIKRCHEHGDTLMWFGLRIWK